MDTFDILKQIDEHILGVFALLFFWFIFWAIRGK